MKKITMLLVAISCLIFGSCSKNDPEPAKSNTKSITKFVFAKVDNPSLTEDVEGTIIGNEIKVVLHGVAKTNLKPTITYTSELISPANVATDFTNPVTYTLTAKDGSTAMYKVTVESRDVYVAGYDYDAVKLKYRAVYWKNGNKVSLTDGTSNAYASDVIVVGNDVYVSGQITLSTGRTGAVYWKNGNQVSLSVDPSTDAIAYLMTASGNDIYISGKIGNKTVYWKNDLKSELTNGSYFSFPMGILVAGNDVYVYGQSTPGATFDLATYWKNGVSTTLTDGTSIANITKMAILGNDLYASGEDKGFAVVWKNGNKTELSKGVAWSMCTSGSDIYVTGIDNSTGKSVAAYWKNGNKVTLTDGQGNASALSIIAIGTDVYIAGNDKTINSVGIPTYWVNGKSTALSTKGFARSIFVK